MKKIILIFTFIQIINLSLFAQTPTEKLEKLRKINQDTIAKYQSGKVDEALQLARSALDLTISIFGNENVETATSYVNLGAIYKENNKYKESIENYQNALAIYQKNPEQNAARISRTLESVGIVLVFDGKKKEGEEFLLRSVDVAENAFGTGSKETLPYLKSLIGFYVFAKKTDQAQKEFIRLYLATSKHFPSESDELENIKDDFYCFIYQNDEPNEIEKRQKDFYEATGINKSRKSIKGTTDEKSDKPINAGVMNSKAKSLAKPEYPATARVRLAHGSVLVKIKIDEEGRVISAKSLCGDRLLQNVSEEAARKSSFTPATVDGKPVKVSGIIVYNFVRK